jgi:alkylation response protein AidB-like acyl-CoA dehydrogenase
MVDNKRDFLEALKNWGEEVASKNIEDRDDNYHFDREIWNEAAKIGLAGLMAPKEFGGLGMNAIDTVAVMEAMAMSSKDGGFNFAISAHNLACVVPIMLYGTEAQKRKYLPKLCSGEWIAANAITESTSGSDAFTMSSVAKKDENDGFILNGEKTFVTNGPVADLVLCYVLTDADRGFLGGATCFLLEKGTHDFESMENEKKHGFRTCTMNKIAYNNVLISSDRVLGRVGWGGKVFHESMIWERTCMPALYVGTLERLLTKAISFAQARTSGGRPISKYQSISHKLVEIKTKVTCARLLVRSAASAIDNEDDATQLASMAKWYASELFQKSMLDLFQVFAGAAFRGNNDVERHLRDSMGATIYSGTTEIQKNIIAGTMGL